MSNVEVNELLNDARVLEAINKHKWIESEKIGYDIGFDKAAEDWLEHYAEEWQKTVSPKKAVKRERKTRSTTAKKRKISKGANA